MLDSANGLVIHPMEDTYNLTRPRGYVPVHLPLSEASQRNLRNLARYHSTNLYYYLTELLHPRLLREPLPPDTRLPFSRAPLTLPSYLVSKRVASLLLEHYPLDPPDPNTPSYQLSLERRVKEGIFLTSTRLQRYLLDMLQSEIDNIGEDSHCLCGCGGRIDPFLDARGRPRWILRGHGYFLRDTLRPREKRLQAILAQGPHHVRAIALLLQQDLAGVRAFVSELCGLGLVRPMGDGYYMLP